MSGNNRSIAALVREGESLLSKTSDSPKLDAELLLCEASGWSKEKLLTSMNQILSDEICEKFQHALSRRASGEPVAYITGKREFWRHTFFVNSSVLIPRPETELIVERAVEFILDKKIKDPNIVDIGTGSGCIACSVAWELKSKGIIPRIIATDISKDALTVAMLNAQKIHVDDVIEFRLGSLFEPLGDLKGGIDLLLSNPPYVAMGDENMSPECAFEPKKALYGGSTGGELIEELINFAPLYLKSSRIALIEIGAGQSDFVDKVAKKKGMLTKFHNDLQGILRTAELSAT